MPPVRLLALVQKAPDISPGQRFRHEQWAPHLSGEHGIEVDFEPFESPELTRVLYDYGRVARKARLVLADSVRRWGARARARHYDGVIVYREAMMLGGAMLERALVAAGLPLIYDFDDAIWSAAPSDRNGLLALARMPWKTAAICRLASAVTVGNEYLAAYARRFNSNVHVVRTSIDVDRFPLMDDPGEELPFTIVWTGSHSTVPHLRSIRSAIERLAEQRPVRLRVISDTQPEPWRNVELEFIRWSPATEAADLAPAHVGIMPLPDTEFTRGKCGCKALQYMAIGRPTVVSPVGVNREIVQDGVNGLWAVTEGDWIDGLNRLADDAALRVQLGAAGRRTVLRGYTGRASAAAMANVIRRVVGRGARSPARRAGAARSRPAEFAGRPE